MDSLSTRRFLRYAEYGLLVIIISLLVLFFLNRVQEVQRNAERMAIKGQINSLQAGVVGMLHLPDGVRKEDLPDMNPVRLLLSPPPDYLGEAGDRRERDIPAGSWYFRPDEGMLVYKARFDHDLPFTEEPTHTLRFTLQSPDQLNQGTQGSILACSPDICLTYTPKPR